jgi:hypothetical protein
VDHAVDLHADIVQVPVPMALGAHRVHAPAADLGRKHRAKPVPPIPHRFMADLDTAFVQQVLYIAQRQRERM